MLTKDSFDIEPKIILAPPSALKDRWSRRFKKNYIASIRMDEY